MTQNKKLSDGAHLSNLTSRPAALQRPRKGTKERKEREDGGEWGGEKREKGVKARTAKRDLQSRRRLRRTEVKIGPPPD